LRRLALDKIVLCEEAQQTVFLGNYDEFLEKVGWDEKKKPAPPKNPQPNVRKERAEEVAKRAAVIKPLEKQVHETEQQIMALEEEQKMSFETATSPELVKAQGVRKKQIEQLETQLYELYELLEKKKKEFESP
jgi:ATP-binding cassette subfamily F protein 3